MTDDLPPACIGGDPACPCQDGAACHYRDAADGTKRWPIPVLPLPDSAREAMRLALEALREARNDIDSAIRENLPNARYASYQRIIAAYREQLADHDAAIDALRAALGDE